MKRPNNFDDLLNVAKYHPDVHGALSQVGISLKHVGYSMGGERWQTETRSGTQGDFSAIAFIHKPDGSWVFYDNKARFGRNSIDPITFLREGFGVSFDDAVYMLSGGAPSAPVAKPTRLSDTPSASAPIPPKKEYIPPESAPDKLRNVKAYLIQTRKLPTELVLPLIESDKIYATYYENKENNKKSLMCAFRITDENGTEVGCDSCSPIPNQKFKHLFEGSDSRYAWCFPYEVSEITSETPIFFCEAPIDTMSLCALSGTPGVYVSMAGLKDSTFNSITEKLGGTPIICVDNDEAGEIFAKRHSDVQRMNAPYGKDWNDTLKYYVENNLSYAFSPPDAAARADVPLEDKDGGHVVHHETEEHEPKKEKGALDKGASEDRNKIISDTIDKALLNKGNINEKYNQKKISLVPEEVAKYVLQASAGQIDISQKYIAINGDNIWHEYKSHQNEIKENSLKQIPLSPADIKEAISAIYNPDIVESIFSDINNPTQRQSFVFAKKSTKGHYVVVEAIGGKNNPNIVPVMILQFNKEKLNEMFNFDKTFGELFFDNDTKKLNALNTKLNKENRVIVAQFVSTETIANTPRSPRFTNIISHNDEKINTSDEKNSNPLNDEDPIGADSNEKLSQDELRAALEGKVKNVVENYRADPRALADYVLFTSRFNNYSANNLRLIWSQYPTAQFVTSAYDFSHGLPDKNGKPTISEKIFIKKGERALRIWKPYDVKYTVMPDGTEKRSAWLTKSERELAKAENWKTLTKQYFTLVPVFDITQTTASPDVYPKLLGLGGTKGTSADKSFEAMKNYAENVLNCPITVCDFEERKASVRGSFYPDLNEIRISDMLEGDNKLSTLIHEIGHASLHADSYANVSKSTAQIELEADMYALMIERRLGIEPTDARCRHLKAHYDMYLAETKATDINADTTLFNNVIDRFREQVPLIDAYVENLNVVEAQTADVKTTQDIKQQEQRVNTTKL